MKKNILVALSLLIAGTGLLKAQSVTDDTQTPPFYATDVSASHAALLMDKSILPVSATPTLGLTAILLEQEKEIGDLQVQKEPAGGLPTVVFQLVALALLVIAVVAYAYARKMIIEPIVHTRNLIVALA